MYEKKLTQISSLFGFKSKVSSRTQYDLMKQAGKFQVLAGAASKTTRGGPSGSWAEGAPYYARTYEAP